MITLLSHWKAILAAAVAVAVSAPPAYLLGHWHGGNAREAELRAEADADRLRAIEAERTRSDEIETLDDADLRRRLDEWVRR